MCQLQQYTILSYTIYFIKIIFNIFFNWKKAQFQEILLTDCFRPRKQKERPTELNKSCNCWFKKIKPLEALDVLGVLEGQEDLEVPVALKVLGVPGGLEVQGDLGVPEVLADGDHSDRNFDAWFDAVQGYYSSF